MIHVRFDGQSIDLEDDRVNIGTTDTDGEIKRKIADHLDKNVNHFDDYIVDRRPHGDIIIRPEAVYG